MVNPITPETVLGTKARALPDAVLTMWNHLIAVNFNNGEARIKQEEVVCRLIERMDVSRVHVFNSRWLEIESLYRDAGWEVEYDKPGYNEEYGAVFIFRAPAHKS